MPRPREARAAVLPHDGGVASPSCRGAAATSSFGHAASASSSSSRSAVRSSSSSAVRRAAPLPLVPPLSPCGSDDGRRDDDDGGAGGGCGGGGGSSPRSSAGWRLRTRTLRRLPNKACHGATPSRMRSICLGGMEGEGDNYQDGARSRGASTFVGARGRGWLGRCKMEVERPVACESARQQRACSSMRLCQKRGAKRMCRPPPGCASQLRRAATSIARVARRGRTCVAGEEGGLQRLALRRDEKSACLRASGALCSTTQYHGSGRALGWQRPTFATGAAARRGGRPRSRRRRARRSARTS